MAEYWVTNYRRRGTHTIYIHSDSHSHSQVPPTTTNTPWHGPLGHYSSSIFLSSGGQRAQKLLEIKWKPNENEMKTRRRKGWVVRQTKKNTRNYLEPDGLYWPSCVPRIGQGRGRITGGMFTASYYVKASRDQLLNVWTPTIADVHRGRFCVICDEVALK